jgi:RNA polymerase sigma-70 factor (ECF subfamily)
MDDIKIVQLYWNRDQTAITETATKYGNYCTSIAKNILGNEEDAEECVNDTYVSAWNSMPPHRPNVLSTFLGKITRNLSYNRYKHNNADKRGRGEISAVLDELSECISGKDNVEQEIEYKELVKTIDSFLDTVSPEKRSIFVCRYWYTDSISVIAKQFNMRENTVSMTLRRIRLKLQKYLKERGYEI